jgi:hypothetical protein
MVIHSQIVGVDSPLQGPPGGVVVNVHVGRHPGDRHLSGGRVTVGAAGDHHYGVFGGVVEIEHVEGGHDGGDVQNRVPC